MFPPFYGTKIVTDINLDDIYPLIDTRSLFVGRWQFKRTKASEEAYQEILRQKAWPVFEEWKKCCIDEAILEPKVVYGYFVAAELALLISAKQALRLQFVPLQVVTVGSRVAEECRRLFAANKYTDYLYLHGLAVEVVEALAEYWHRRVLKELGISPPLGRNGRLPAMSRISPGYPVWPDLKEQKVIYDLLDAGRIGVQISETFQLVPEYSTSAMIVV